MVPETDPEREGRKEENVQEFENVQNDQSSQKMLQKRIW